MPPKKPLSIIEQLKIRVQAQKLLEQQALQEAEEATRREREEIRLAENQRKIEEQEKARLAELNKEKKKDNKSVEENKRKLEVIERMRLGGMIMPKDYQPATNDTVAPSPATKKETIESVAEIIAPETNLRALICGFYGQPDSGKTTLIDYIRNTNVHDKEVRGITQGISAWYLPPTASTQPMILIDLPGHESFSNMKTRGSNVCDIAIVVIDIMSGLEPETKKALKLLTSKNIPFIVALNKIDRLYGWEPNLAQQKQFVQIEYETRVHATLLQLAEEGINADIQKKADYVQVVPISSVTGEGVNDLMVLLVKSVEEDQLIFRPEIQCTVLDVRPIINVGIGVDAVLVNGVLCCGDRVAMCSSHGAVITKIKKIMVQEAGGGYRCGRTARGAMCVRLFADELDHIVPGSKIVVITPGQCEKTSVDEVMSEMNSVLTRVSKYDIGVSVYASSFGALEAILEYLEKEKVPVGSIGIGAVRGAINVVRTSESDPKHAVILAFGVHISEEMREIARKHGVRICSSDIIYTLFDQFRRQQGEYVAMRKEKNRGNVVFPVQVQVIAAFRNKDPIVVGVKVQRGILRLGTSVCVRDGLCDIGKIVSIQKDKKELAVAKAGDEVAIAIQTCQGSIAVGRTFEVGSVLCSRISRESIDALKESFRDELTTDDWKLVIELKGVFGV